MSHGGAIGDREPWAVGGCISFFRDYRQDPYRAIFYGILLVDLLFPVAAGPSPRTDLVTLFPRLVRFHVVNAFILIGLFSFPLIVHILPIPFFSVWRPYQIASWHRGKNGKRAPDIY